MSTIKSNVKSPILGYPFKQMRAFMRLWQGYSFNADAVVAHFGKDIAADLLAEGLIELNNKKPGDDGSYKLSALGVQVAAKMMVPCIPREKADKIVADMLERAHKINAMPELPLWISKITLFGSYLTEGNPRASRG